MAGNRSAPDVVGTSMRNIEARNIEVGDVVTGHGTVTGTLGVFQDRIGIQFAGADTLWIAPGDRIQLEEGDN